MLYEEEEDFLLAVEVAFDEEETEIEAACRGETVVEEALDEEADEELGEGEIPIPTTGRLTP